MVRPIFPSLVCFVSLFAGAACGGDADDSCSGDACKVGACTSNELGRELVQMPNGRLAYAGQAILLQTCANGCHSSQATGALRQDAPEGLDFDLAPLALGDDGVDSTALAGMRARQEVIFERRDEIWREVREGRMPLGGVFSEITLGERVDVATDGTCSRGEALGPLLSASTQQLLREWLACGAPFVEAEGDLPTPEGGTFGDRYPSCEPEVLDPTFENVYAVLESGGCAVAGCHGGAAAQAGLDLSTRDSAYLELVGAGSGGMSTCGGAAYVTPGSPGESYLLTKLGGEGTRCGVTMPPAGPLSLNSRDLIERWILAGAPGPSN